MECVESGSRADYDAVAAEALELRAASIALPTAAATVSRTARSAGVNPSCWARYKARTAKMPAEPSTGTATAERSVLYLVGSLRYPGSTDGFPFRIAL